MVCADLEEAARVGGCGLATVELDRRAGEETPRVTVKRLQAFETLAIGARMVLEIAVDTPDAVPVIADLLSAARGGRGEVEVSAALAPGGRAWLVLGRDFLLDAELASRIEGVQGVGDVTLRPADGRRLALVG